MATSVPFERFGAPSESGRRRSLERKQRRPPAEGHADDALREAAQARAGPAPPRRARRRRARAQSRSEVLAWPLDHPFIPLDSQHFIVLIQEVELRFRVCMAFLGILNIYIELLRQC